MNRLDNIKKRLKGRREQEVNKRNEARSVENFSRGMQEKRLSNGNIPCYACGILNRPRYINERMEIELYNFKIEVEKRFHKSLITEYKFPRKFSTSGDDNIPSSNNKSIHTEKLSEKNKLMIDRWKTIDNYYQK